MLVCGRANNEKPALVRPTTTNQQRKTKKANNDQPAMDRPTTNNKKPSTKNAINQQPALDRPSTINYQPSTNLAINDQPSTTNQSGHQPPAINHEPIRGREETDPLRIINYWTDTFAGGGLAGRGGT
ncbi:MAG: hypothetical protein AB7V14_08075 [Kiritimatiellia bacterium]